ncbi:MAG: anthranilate phosphoribosyltransferase [Deltaproteobacteria bacterium]|nr:anthranilate phosphoribosyltransferase [Deltaproteobacteria bacterium]
MQLPLERLLNGSRLTVDENQAMFAGMLEGTLSEVEVAAILAAWRLIGEDAGELYAGAQVMRQHAVKLDLPSSERPLIDNCGTGGDGSNSFNLSTAAAIVASSAGVKVAKHGNRSVSSKCGSADLLFAAGFPPHLGTAAAGQLLAQTGFTFFFAPNFHPLLARLAPVRKQLRVRTIFNLLGPLANPIRPECQLIGVGAIKYLKPMAEAVRLLGIERALVVHARDGLDELSPTALTDAYVVEGQKLQQLVIDPKNLAIRGTSEDLAGGDANFNLERLNALLAGKAPGLADAVALNAGAVIWLAGKSSDLPAGVSTAREKLASGASEAFFKSWLAAAHTLAL